MSILSTDTSAKAYDQLIIQSKVLTYNDRIEFIDQLHQTCVTYAHTRALEAFNPEAASRSNQHTNVITSLNILERLIAQANGDNSWRDLIGRSSEGEERKQQGDFACYVAYMLAISKR